MIGEWRWRACTYGGQHDKRRLLRSYDFARGHVPRVRTRLGCGAREGRRIVSIIIGRGLDDVLMATSRCQNATIDTRSQGRPAPVCRTYCNVDFALQSTASAAAWPMRQT